MRALHTRLAARFRAAGAGVSSSARRGVRRLAGLQGVAGVVCLAGGAYQLAGQGVALVVLGGFLLLGAWAAR